MQKKATLPLLACVIAIVSLIAHPSLEGAESSDGKAKVAHAERVLQTMIKAVIANNYRAFLAPGSKDLAGRISEHRFSMIREDAGPVLKNGYAVSYDLKVPEPDGSTSYHWKITPQKGDGELHAILVLEAGKVSNFSLQ